MNNLPAASGGYRSILERAAADPNIDIDKLERLVAMQEAFEQRQASLYYNEAMAAAQNEMFVVVKNEVNPQTRSKYATYAALYRALAPIWTKHGFGVQFNEELSGDPNIMRVVAFVSHGAEIRKFQWDTPISKTGIAGKVMMTDVHAKAAATTYGRRNLLTMIFNIATDDSDGNLAPRAPPAPPPPPSVQIRTLPPEPPHDPETGELLGPHRIDLVIDAADAKGSYQRWGSTFNAAVDASEDEEAIDRWWELNVEELAAVKNVSTKMSTFIETSTQKTRNRIKLAKGKEGRGRSTEGNHDERGDDNEPPSSS